MAESFSSLKYSGSLILIMIVLFPVSGLLARQKNADRHPVIGDTVSVEEVVVLSDQIKKSRVIVPTSHITAVQMEQFSPAVLTDVVNQIAGVYIQSGAVNTNRMIIRGVGSRTLYGTNKIRAYFNGIPVTSGIGETVIDIYDPEDLNNLEIIKGPKATEFGTNLGGTILLNTGTPRGGPSVKSNTTAGSYGLFKNSTVAAYGDDRLNLHLRYDHMQLDGFRENSNYDRNGWLLNAGFSVDGNSEIGLLVHHTGYLAQIASSISKSAFEEDPSQAAENWKSAKGYEDDRQTLVGLNYSRQLGDSFRNTTSFFFNGADHYEPRPFNILDEKTSGYGVRTVFSMNLAFWQKGQLHFGGEWYADQYDWSTFENLYQQNDGKGSLRGNLISKNREFRDYFNIFASASLPLSARFKAQLGVNLNKTAYDYNDRLNPGTDGKSATRNFDPVLAPNFSLTYHYALQGMAYLNVSRGFNYPGLEETLTPEGVLNPDIGPEKGWNYEIGNNWSLFHRKLQLDLSVYLLRINGLLVARRTGEDAYVGMNAGKTKHRGIEFSADYRIDLLPQLSVSPYLNGSFNFHRFVDFVDGENDYSGNELTGVPDKRINGGIRLQYLDRAFLFAGYEHTGSMPMNDANSLYSDPYDLFNLKAQYKARLSRHWILETSAGVNNLTDERYASAILINAVGTGGGEPRYYYPGTPRNWYGELKVMYRF